MMGGWKTWLAVIGNLALGVYNFVTGDPEAAMTFVAMAMGLLGIGSKIESNGIGGK